MSPTMQLAWVEHWKEHGLELQYHAGRLHYLSDDYPTKEPTWLDVHSLFTRLAAECKLDKLDDRLCDFARERYCCRCKEFCPPDEVRDDPSEVEDMLCEDCIEEDEDSATYNRIGAMAYYGLSEGDF